MVWLPLRITNLFSKFLTTTPSLSQSGSVPITISPLTLSASSIAILRASGSSGFGETTVGKSPLGSRCSSTI